MAVSRFILGILSLLLMPAMACAFEMPRQTAGEPLPWQIAMQLPVTPVMEMLYDMHTWLTVLAALISAFVLALLTYVCWRFYHKRNPIPSKTTHNVFIEVIWTAIPVLVLIIVAIPSLRTLYFMDKIEDADMTLKVVGHQWYWHYEYPDEGISFDSNMIEDADLQSGQLRLLEVDNRVVVPVDTSVRVLVVAADVNHNWAIPSFGVKMDAVTGRMNETWFRATQEGVYRGQCSELCGIKHGFMPIVVEVVSKEKYAEWLKMAKEEFAMQKSSGGVFVAQQVNQ